MPIPQAKYDTREMAVICNITEEEFGPMWFDFGTFVILGKAAGEKFALTQVTGRDSRMDIGERNTRTEWVWAKQIADDIVRILNGNQQSDANVEPFSGVFVCQGQTPTEAELAGAHAKLKRFYEGRLRIADESWERFKNPIFILDVDRRAARYLNKLEKPWLFDTQQETKCPACAENVRAEAVVCRHCGFTLNRKKALALGIIEDESQSAVPGTIAHGKSNNNQKTI